MVKLIDVSIKYIGKGGRGEGGFNGLWPPHLGVCISWKRNYRKLYSSIFGGKVFGLRAKGSWCIKSLVYRITLISKYYSAVSNLIERLRTSFSMF